MSVSPLIKVVVHKCRLTLEREENMRTDWPLGVILHFLNQNPTPVAVWGIFERALGLPVLETCCGCQGTEVPGRTWLPVGRLYEVQKVSYMVFLRITIWMVKEGEKRCFQRERPGWGFSSAESCYPKLGRTWLCTCRKEGRACCCCWPVRESLFCRESRKKERRLIRTLKTLYARISVAQAIRSERTAHDLSAMMIVVSLQMKTLLRSVAC